MPGELKSSQSEQRHKVANVKAVGGGIKATIDRARLSKMGYQRIATAHLGHKAEAPQAGDQVCFFTILTLHKRLPHPRCTTLRSSIHTGH